MEDYQKAIERVTEAEISRVFAGIHLEAIASMSEHSQPQGSNDSLLGNQEVVAGDEEGEVRSKICHDIMASVRPLVEPWGVKVVNFQISSVLFADDQFAKEYEKNSLNVARTNAQKRTANAQREITIIEASAEAQKLGIDTEAQNNAQVTMARGEADARLIRAKAEADSRLIEAEAEAKSRKIEAQARNDAADAMKHEFARQYALAGQQVEIARSLNKLTSLTVLPQSIYGNALGSSMSSTTKLLQ